MSIRVVYYLGGRLNLLQWWTHNTQRHIILARNERSLYDTAKRVFASHKDEIRLYEFCAIEVVGPSPQMCRDATVYNRQEDIESFYQEVSGRLHEALAAGRALPPWFAVCESYNPPYEVDPENTWALERHQECRNCQDKIRLVGLTTETLYDRFHAAWTAENPTKYTDRTKRLPSMAQPAIDGEPLWYAHPNFGHHAYGVELRDVNYNEERIEGGRPSFLSKDILFYFRRGPDLDKAPLQALLDEQKKSAKTTLEQRSNELKRQREQETASRVDKAIKFFSEKL